MSCHSCHRITLPRHHVSRVAQKFASVALPPLPKIDSDAGLASNLLAKGRQISGICVRAGMCVCVCVCVCVYDRRAGVSNETTFSLSVKLGDDGRPNEDLVCLVSSSTCAHIAVDDIMRQLKFVRAYTLEVSQCDALAQADEVRCVCAACSLHRHVRARAHTHSTWRSTTCCRHCVPPPPAISHSCTS
jgi:hypothetical protein